MYTYTNMHILVKVNDRSWSLNESFCYIFSWYSVSFSLKDSTSPREISCIPFNNIVVSMRSDDINMNNVCQKR